MAHVDEDALPDGVSTQRPEVGVAVILLVALAVLVGSRRIFRSFL